MTTRKRVYIAAPLFSDPEKSSNLAMAEIVERYCDVFLPQRDGYLIPDLIKRGMTSASAYAYVFNRDVTAVRESDVLLINLDGRTVDEGAAFELGLAFASCKICIGYRTDVRTLIPWGLNPMIVAPLARVFDNLNSLEGWFADYVALSKEKATG